MNYVEYGKENSDVIILLHGGGLSWWNYKEVAERLQTDYHVVLPILDGHAGCDKQFTTIENNALDIIEFVNSKLGGSVLMMGGLSLGGQILLEILSQRKDICKYAIVESVLVIPSKFTYSMIKPAFGSCYGLIKYKWFSKLQFKSLRIKSNLFDEYYKDTCAIRKSDMIAFLQENSVYSLKDGIGECEATIMVNGTNFYSTNNAVAVEVDDSVIQYTTSYAENGVPKKDGEANFNKDTGTPYAILEDGMVVVLIDNEWIEFKTK